MKCVRPIDSIFADVEVMAEVQDLLASRKRFPNAELLETPKASLRAYVEGRGATPRPGLVTAEPEGTAQEAIIVSFGRPALLVQDNSFQAPESAVWRDRLEPHRGTIDGLLPSVGRVELLRHPDFEWVGTAWVLGEDILITNRHVAVTFAEQVGQGFSFRHNLFGQPISARVDFREEHQRPAAAEIAVKEVLFIAETGNLHPDVAVLRVEVQGSLPAPLPLAERDAEAGQIVAAVGYPARDSRNGQSDMARIFGNVFDVKRLAPGFLTQADHPFILQHDCSTLGGNSGSPLIDPSSGEAVGLHFAGRFQQSNFAVKASALRQILERVRPTRTTTPRAPEGDVGDAADYEGRQGYKEDFLGADGDHFVPLPRLNENQQAAAARRPGRRGECAYVLDYTHFSLALAKTRKLAFFTAVNIDGGRLVNLRRQSTPWRLDPRIPLEFQAGNELYRNNDLDRGHLVRRLDPVWGSEEEAEQANADSFHYTNAAPQHAGFNQRTWLELEDHLLDNAGAENLKISVFTGPVFGDHDRVYRGVQLPEEFWKVVTMVREDGRLHATAYLLTQADLLTDFEFAFGAFKTFQVPVTRIEGLTQFSFGRLPDFDPLAGIEGPESLRLLRRVEDVIL
jgi:endonuclease G